jgi:hypothetical protein
MGKVGGKFVIILNVEKALSTEDIAMLAQMATADVAIVGAAAG